MIPRTCPQDTDRLGDWRAELRQAITKPETLLDILRLPKSRWLAGARQASQLFPLKVPRGFVARMNIGDPHDPLLRQVLPLADEIETAEGYSHDPVGDQAAMENPGLLQKYDGRILMINTGACAVHCRYCFRRHFPYAQAHTGGRAMQLAIQSIRKNIHINEVILSGGDPLMLDDDQWYKLLQQFESMPHIRRIRIHSRLPIVLPERINESWLETLGTCSKQLIMVIHCNHPQEVDDRVIQALEQMHQASIRLLNQSVLLRGVNDQAEAMIELSEKLFALHVLPYYLHLLDRVQGAAHFDISQDHAIEIYRNIQSRLPGYLVPKLVREIQGQPSKSVISV